MIKAVGEYVIAEIYDPGEDRPFTVEDSSSKMKYLKVLSVGDKVEDCQTGDIILPYGQEFPMIELDGHEVIVLQAHQVAGILDV